MPRRTPPTSLRLVTGPMPSRNAPKHTMPSAPQAVFHSRDTSSRCPAPRRRDSEGSILDLSFSPRSQAGTPRVVRGPWDHSGSIKITVDVEHLLTPMKPVAHA